LSRRRATEERRRLEAAEAQAERARTADARADAEAFRRGEGERAAGRRAAMRAYKAALEVQAAQSGRRHKEVNDFCVPLLYGKTYGNDELPRGQEWEEK
jgi:hypothetical protein